MNKHSFSDCQKKSRKNSKMNLIKSLLGIFRFPRIPTNTVEEKKVLSRRIAKQTSNGNILLQRGYFLTQEDIALEKRKLQTL